MSKVSFSSENAAGDACGVLTGDPGKTKKGLIVIHEWWGLTEWVQEEGAMIAEKGGFLVLVPDMYRGKLAIDRETAGHYMGDLDWLGALKDITAGANFLKSKGCTKVGVTGFCMGGALTLAAAANCPEISAAAPFYGIPKAELADITTIRIPVQAHFGDLDHVIGLSDKETASKAKAQMLAAGVPLEFHEYSGVGHAFTNPNSPFYNEEAMQLSLSRLYAFMQKHLQ